jgi:hypothetical protein
MSSGLGEHLKRKDKSEYVQVGNKTPLELMSIYQDLSARICGYVDRLIGMATELDLLPNNTHTEDLPRVYTYA